jgi:hypothetical protein
MGEGGVSAESLSHPGKRIRPGCEWIQLTTMTHCSFSHPLRVQRCVVFGGWLFVVAVVFGGCGGEAPPAAAPVLAEIPQPDLESLEPHVRHQIERTQARLDEAMASGRHDPADLGRLFGEQGQLYFAYQFDQAAQACFVNALHLAPEEVAWAYYLGHLFRRAGRADQSRTYFEQALTHDPDYLPTIFICSALLNTDDCFFNPSDILSNTACGTMNLVPFVDIDLMVSGEK